MARESVIAYAGTAPLAEGSDTPKVTVPFDWESYRQMLDPASDYTAHFRYVNWYEKATHGVKRTRDDLEYEVSEKGEEDSEDSGGPSKQQRRRSCRPQKAPRGK